MSYTQLTLAHRYEINGYLKAGFSKPQIATELAVNKSTIYREIDRNTGLRGYRPKQAQEKADARRRNAGKHIRFSETLKERVEFFVKQDWSPEQISGYLAQQEQLYISHETIYQHIWTEKQNGGTLFKHLRCSAKKKRKRYGKKDSRGQIKDRLSIDERPSVVDLKERVGDWEIDTVIGKSHKGALVTAVERKTKFTCIEHVPNTKADLVSEALIKMLCPFKDKVLTITSDNGKEFALHKQISQALDAQLYFAHPYHAWERGLNENTNGLIRQYFPKSFALDNIDKLSILFVENRLNQRPGKLLNFKTPNQCFFNSS